MENPPLIRLRSLILEAKRNLESLEVHDSRMTASRELLEAAVALADELVETPAAPPIGATGGKAKSKKDPNFHKRIPGTAKKDAVGRSK
jgi:hypothetical protein